MVYSERHMRMVSMLLKAFLKIEIGPTLIIKGDVSEH